jgi:glycosidase
MRSLVVLLLGFCMVACGGDDDDGGGTTEPKFPEKDWAAESAALLEGPDWFRHAVVYEVYVRSFQDSDGDGIGDLPGLTTRLDDLKALGVDAIWLMPIMPTAFKDSGYDVSDYENVNPDYGTLDDFDALLTAAHDRKMRVIIDLVLNHTSDQHAWFQESRADKTNPKADWYVWSDTPAPPDNQCPTDNPTFGDDPWTLDPTRNQYYFHRFYPAQPDLNYRNPQVVTAALDIAKLWLDRGVDGFRCDVIELLVEDGNNCEFVDETKAVVRQLRELLDGYDERVMVAEPSTLSDASPLFGDGSDMFHMAFHFGYGYFWGFPFGASDAAPIKSAFQKSLDTYPSGAQDALVIGSHDVARAYATAQGNDSVVHRAAAIQLTAAGTPFIYYGEELGLHPGTAQVVDTRDFQRTPMLWSAEAGFGFSDATPWIPFGADPETTNLAVEKDDPDSTYSFYRAFLELRRGRKVWGTGSMQLLDTGTTAVFALLREDDFMGYVAAVNMTAESQKVSVTSESFVGPAARVLGKGTLSAKKGSATLSLPADSYGVFRFR